LVAKRSLEREDSGMTASNEKATTGIAGLDDVLGGGFTRGRIYLVEGGPGAGKTTVGLQFLLEGAKLGERCLYITMSETTEELRSVAASHGWSLADISSFELSVEQDVLTPDQQQSLLHPSVLELGEATEAIIKNVEALKPDRIVLDSVGELRLLSQSGLRFRHQLLALKQYFLPRRTTVVLLDAISQNGQDMILHSLVHGVLRLEQFVPAYGAERRRLSVTRYRGTRFRGGFHDFVIRTGGLSVFPRLVAAEHRRPYRGELETSGVAGLDALLGGGLERGTGTIITGPAGCGKSLLALHYAVQSADKGHKAAYYAFEEELGLLLERAEAIGVDLAGRVNDGQIFLQQVDAAELSPGEFAHELRARVERDETRVVVIDSLNGYYGAMPEERFLVLHVHALLSFLSRRGAVTIMTLAQHGLLGEMRAPVDLTYLCDTLLTLRLFETAGRLRKAVSVVKKRAGFHKDTIHELLISSDGLKIGDPLINLHGVMRGVPDFVPASDAAIGHPGRSPA
jgi:circadian clock protein KaiC